MGRFTSWAIMLEGLFHMWISFVFKSTNFIKDRATRTGKQIWSRACMWVVEAKESYFSKLQQGKVGKSKT
jgi:hypothetical protein